MDSNTTNIAKDILNIHKKSNTSLWKSGDTDIRSSASNIYRALNVVDIPPSYRCLWVDIFHHYERIACDFHCLVTSVKLLCYLTIHKLLWCYNLAKRFKCYLLNLLSFLQQLIPVLVLLIASLTMLICLQLFLIWFQMTVVWLHMLLHMLQANLYLQIHEYLSSLKLLNWDWLYLVC